MESGPMSKRADTTTLSRFILSLCDAAGAAILPHFRNLPGIDNKLEGGFDPVTEGDRAAERAIRAMIETTYPDDGILGEEYGPKLSRSGRVWVLDPIDGTRAFVCGLPTWMTLIGLIDGEQAVIGAAHQAFVGETFLGNAEGTFAYRNGKRVARLRAAGTAELRHARCGTTGPARYSLGSKGLIYAALRSQVREFRHDADAYFFAMVAAGQMEIAIDTGLQTYDIAALVPIITGAGGCVTSWSGGSPLGGGDIVASAGPALHETVLAMLADQDDPTKASKAAQN
jgi:histidinol phosphatase-like enzyme (inositol monophosphatase family)